MGESEVKERFLARHPKRWETRRRLEEIERCLYWAGSVGRGDLIDRFGISPQQASADLKAYIAGAGDTIEFRHSGKRYLPTDNFAPRLITPSIEDYASWAGEIGVAVASVPVPFRAAKPETLRALTRALHQGYSVSTRYRSLTHPRGTARRITPHTLVFSGERYHIRAYCHERQEFRDFVLGRVLEAMEPGEAGPGSGEDTAWNTLVIARIGPHPGLTTSQRQVIEGDYAMVDGEAEIQIRQALLLYFLTHFRLDGRERTRAAVPQQIVLLNPEIRRLIV